ncbi:RNF213 [Symbiodinium sp. CCMP2592]|nr:RNF213 [Symbiodinium sp. CCMP2592]
MNRRAGLPWEQPYATADLEKDLTVQVISDLQAARRAFMAEGKGLKDFSKWLGKPVKVIEINSKQGVKCEMLFSKSQKPETIWMVSAALTKPVASDKDFVRRYMAGIYSSVHRRLFEQSQLRVHLFCEEAPEGVEMCCTNLSSTRNDAALMQSCPPHHFCCTLGVPPSSEMSELTLRFILNQDRSVPFMERVLNGSILNDMLGRSDLDNLLQSDVNIAHPSNSYVFCQVMFEGKQNLEQADLYGHFVSSFYKRLAAVACEGASDAAELQAVLLDFAGLCQLLPCAPNLEDFLKQLAMPINSAQAVLAVWIVGRLVKLDDDDGFAPGEWVILNLGCLRRGKKHKKKGQQNEMEANLNTVVPLVTISPLESSTFVLHSLAACSLDSVEFESLIDTQDEDWRRGLSTLLLADARKGGSAWLDALRQMVRAETLYGNLALEGLLHPVAFNPDGGDFDETMMRRSLGEMQNYITEMSTGACEALWEALLGNSYEFRTLLFVVGLCEAPRPQQVVELDREIEEPQPESTGASDAGEPHQLSCGQRAQEQAELQGAKVDAQIMVHALLGSQTGTDYSAKIGKQRRSLGEVCDIFSGASSLARHNLHATFEQCFGRAASDIFQVERLEDLDSEMAAIGELLARNDFDDMAALLLRRTMRQLWIQCRRSDSEAPVVGQRAAAQASRKLVGSFTQFSHALKLSDDEVMRLLREYVELQMLRYKSTHRKPLAALLVATELLELLQKSASADALAIAIASIEAEFDAVGERALLEILPGLSAAEVLPVRRTTDDRRLSARSVEVCLTALSGQSREHAEAALETLLNAAQPLPDPLSLLDDDGIPWRRILEEAMSSLQTWLKDVLEGNISLRQAEEVLQAKPALLEILPLYQELKTEAEAEALSSLDQARAAIQPLQNMVEAYVQKAQAARAFLTLCYKCELPSAASLHAAGQELLQLDRQRNVSELPALTEDRWWFSQCPEEIRHLPESGMFVRYAHGYLMGATADAEDDDNADGTEMDPDFAEAVPQADVGELERHMKLQPSECARLVREFPQLLEGFRSVCESMAGTPLTSMDLGRLRALLPLDEVQQVREDMASAAQVSGVAFPKEMCQALEQCSRLGEVSTEIQALCTASRVWCLSPEPWEQMEDQLLSLQKELSDDGDPPSISNILKDGLGSNGLRSASLIFEAVRKAASVLSAIRGNGMDDILRALADAAELHNFLEPMLDEDLRPLQDAVEENSNAFIRPDTIVALVDIQRLFRSLHQSNRTNLLQRLSEVCGSLSLDARRDVASKLRLCVQHCYGLSNLYQNLSSQEEMAGKKILQASQSGVYKLTCTGHDVEVSLSYPTHMGNDKVQASLSKHQLLDLRARALLRVDDSRTLDSAETPSTTDTTMAGFVQEVEVLLDVAEALDLLRQEGYPWAGGEWKASNPGALEKLLQWQSSFEQRLQDWQCHLGRARERFPEMCFLYSQQLWIMSDFVHSRSISPGEERLVMSVLSFIQGRHLSAEERTAVLSHETSDDAFQFVEDLESWLAALGKGLKQVVSRIASSCPSISACPDLDVHMEAGLRSIVKPGVPRSAMAKRGEEVLPLALSFYGGSGFLPLASQVLFCSSCTVWPQLEAFLERCKHVGGLHCLIHVERLTYSLQHKLVGRIKGGRMGSSFRLVIVALAEDDTQVHVLREIPPEPADVLSPEGLREFVMQLAPNLMIVESEEAGCGKTELIRQRAFASQKVPVTVPLSGPLDVADLITRLLGRSWQPYDCLHLEIGPTEQPELLSDMLTQLSLWGVLQSGASFCMVPCSSTFVELANLSSPILRTLPFRNLVMPKVVRFSVRSLQVSDCPRSPVQVVCCTLDSLDQQTLNMQPLCLGKAAIPEARCQDLLEKYVVQKMNRGSVSYSLMLALLRVLAVQLVCFHQSTYFQCATLKELGLKDSLRTLLVEQAIEACCSFLGRAVTVSKMRQRHQHDQTILESCAEAFEGMSRWSDVRPFILFNTFDRQTLTAIYHDRSTVSKAVLELFQSQSVNGQWVLPDYKNMSTKDLEARLVTTVVPLDSQPANRVKGSEAYVISPDNFLKMIWIALRIESNVPVVIMGETGCGKTSLIRYLSTLMNVQFRCLNVHAGTSSHDIASFVLECADQAQGGGVVWAFLDEVNTCDHMGMITEIICHHRVFGKALPTKVKILAACNPYRKKPKPSAHEAAVQRALALSDSSHRRRHSDLVYSVQELPEALYDYLYDFGFLGKPEERSYVQSMVEQKFESRERDWWLPCITELITESHQYTARHQPACLLSLRDVKRCVDLIDWFKAHLMSRSSAKAKARLSRQRQSGPVNNGYSDTKLMLLAVLNALAISYQFRLPTKEHREDYADLVASILAKHQVHLPRLDYQWRLHDKDVVHRLLMDEMREYFKLMPQRPDLTAPNEALLENVFVMMVCILNKIPLFVVGKPGNSKSLALQIIYANLRGQDSQEELWRMFPPLNVISYQGSDVSTSEGVLRVFEKAKSCEDGKSIPVVHFDEIGLAEASPNNPLKCIHGCLEPGDRLPPAMVGLSNSPLDAAKLNRGITVVRPPPTLKDLKKTAEAICEGLNVEAIVDRLAQAYYFYYQVQVVEDFHALRDFYFSVKALAQTFRTSGPRVNEQRQAIFRAAFRNFGGLPPDLRPGCGPCPFLEMQWGRLGLPWHMAVEMLSLRSVLEGNLDDKLAARHLLLVCSGGTETAVGLLQDVAQRQERKIQIMVGSAFDEDKSDRYAFSLLKRVMISMQRGDILVLRGLDVIHGSLYDMLNMSYTTMSGKQYCRVALGDAYRLTEVHDSFRCVVLQEQSQLPTLDPAFLNRFEKHFVGIECQMTHKVQKHALERLHEWAWEATSVPCASHLRIQDVFVGWGPETAASLVAHVSSTAAVKYHRPEPLLLECWRRLVSVATMDGVLRATELTSWANSDQRSALEWRNLFFAQPSSLSQWLFASGWQHAPSEDQSSSSRLAIVVTMSPLQVNLSDVLQDSTPGYLVVAVDALTSELDLEKKIDEFSASNMPPGSVLVLQCRANSVHVELVRHRVYSQLAQHYRALLILHGNRKMLAPSSTARSLSMELNFQCGWTQVFLEQLNSKKDLNVPKCISLSLEQQLEEAGPLQFERILSSVLPECFWHIKYPATTEAARHVKDLTEVILQDRDLTALFKHACMESICTRTKSRRAWWHQVATDMQLLRGHASFADCIEAYVRQQVRRPAAMLIHRLENMCALKTIKLYPADCELRRAWFDICRQVVSLEGVAPPEGSECYPYRHHLQMLQIPFAAHFAEKLDSFRALYFEQGLDAKGPAHPAWSLLRRSMEAAIPAEWLKLLHDHKDTYVEDLAALRLSAVPLPQAEQLRVLKPILQDRAHQWEVSDLHRYLWQHQDSLQTVLRQLAALPVSIRGLDRFIAAMSGQEAPARSDMPSLVALVTDHACSALHPCLETLSLLRASWLPNAQRALSAARSALDGCSSTDIMNLVCPVSVGALSVVVKISQALETDVLAFWMSEGLNTSIAQPAQLQNLMARIMDRAQSHMDARTWQKLQLSTHQELIAHGASDAMVCSLTEGIPVVGSAIQLRNLVVAAVRKNPACFLEECRGFDADEHMPEPDQNELRTLRALARTAGPSAPLTAILCVEIEDHGFPPLQEEAFVWKELLPAALQKVGALHHQFGLGHVVAGAVLRAAASQGAASLVDAEWSAVDGLDGLCSTSGGTRLSRAHLPPWHLVF